jgi:NADH-quinone oxidoreductase subunit E
MLSEQEQQEIQAELERAPTKQAACIDALKIVQKHRGWVSDEALADIAPVLDMTTAELDTVATFYNLIFRKPVGKHVILVCDSISCFLTGGETVMGCLVEKLGIQPGQTTDDGLFTLLPTVCLGHCEQGPVMMLDWEIIGNLDETQIDRALEAARTRSEKDSG